MCSVCAVEYIILLSHINWFTSVLLSKIISLLNLSRLCDSMDYKNFGNAKAFIFVDSNGQKFTKSSFTL